MVRGEVDSFQRILILIRSDLEQNEEEIRNGLISKKDKSKARTERPEACQSSSEEDPS